MNADFWNNAGRAVKRLAEVAAVLLLAFLLLWFMVGVLAGGGMVETFFKYATIILFFVFLASVVVKLVLSLFVKDHDEEREMEELVDLILRKKQQRTVDAGREVSSPLVGLGEAQVEAVCGMLKALPAHHTDGQRISLAPTVQFLTALKEMELLDDSDHNNLYRWVGQTTHRTLPSFREFNEAYPSATHTKVNRYKEKIRDALAKVR